jgi:phosphopantothenoylcysteine decarboxylase/phosphopantothenate--cysteine ligase
MKDFTGANILVGITGGVAAYKALLLIRELTHLGADIRVVMTDSASHFVTPLSIQALSGQPPRTALFDAEAEKGMSHIELARWADLFVIAPASANCLAKFAYGLADDLLSTLFLVNTNPVVICPAMNHSMWSHPATKANVATLRSYGVMVMEPDEGAQACGEFGPGRLPEVEAIIEQLRLADFKTSLQGQTVLITAGPTIEAIDPVRYLSNRSSGKMGYALARAAKHAGAKVLLVSGPVSLSPPSGVQLYRVESAADMLKTVNGLLKKDMIVIGCAAVSDFSVTTPQAEKIKRGQAKNHTLELINNPDIIATVAKSGLPAYVVGFAAETQHVLAHAKDKLVRKQLDLVVANEVGNDKVFGKETNQVTLITSDKVIELPNNHKTRIAAQIIAFITTNLQNTPH